MIFMFASFLLSFREGLEAALIIGILLGTLKKLGHKKQQKVIWLGTGVAVIFSILVAVTLNYLGAAFEGHSEEIFEGIAMIIAAGILTSVITWMQAQSHLINKKLESDVKIAVSNNNRFALFSLVFLSVFREGVELAIFLSAAAISSEIARVIVGAILGLSAVVILAILLFKSLFKLNMAKFFQATRFILIFFAAGLVAHGVHELNEAGLIPSIIEHVWDINNILDERSTVGEFLKTLVGYNGNPSLTEVGSYLLYLLGILVSSKKFGQ
jgi:high-affinity iron transporter